MRTTPPGPDRARWPAREKVERFRDIMRSTPRSRSYPALGAALALATPVGLLLLSNTDPLTGLLNRRRFDERWQRRWGDEFAVLLPQTSAGQTWALSQRILADVARHCDARAGQLAVSIGISELDGTTEVDSERMLAAADAALYGAKAAGGGHAVMAGRVAEVPA